MGHAELDFQATTWYHMGYLWIYDFCGKDRTRVVRVKKVLIVVFLLEIDLD